MQLTETTMDTPTPNQQNSSSTPPPSGQASQNTGMAILAYLGILVIIPLISDAKNDPFVKFHIKQGLVMLVIWVLGSVLFWFPILGWLLWLGVVILTIMGIMSASRGEMKELPIVGRYASNFKF